MKRLWKRLGLVAGLLAIGVAGVIVAQRHNAPEADETLVAEQGDLTGESLPLASQMPRPIPLQQSDYGIDSHVAESSVPAEETTYRNELDTQEGYDTARFVDSPPARPSARFSSSPASYAQHDSEGNSGIPSENTAASSDRYSTMTTDSLPEAPPASADYASRYGDPDGSYGTGAALGSPRELEALDDADESFAVTADLADNDAEFATSTANVDKLPESPATADLSSTIAAPPVNDSPIPAAPTYAPAIGAVPQQQYEPQATSTANLPNAIASSSVAATIPAALASDIPGARQLEGAQTPTLTLEKRAPSEVSVGQPAAFEVIVRNVGSVTARGVVVSDRVPQGAKLVSTNPQHTPSDDGALAWSLGDLEPGDQAKVSMELMPLVEGELGSVAQISFTAQASVRTISTKPELVVTHSGPERILIGEDVVFEITLSNPGSGVTTGVVVEEDVPVGLVHVAGEKLEFEVGTLRPKEEKRLQLILKADKAGVVKNVLRVKADNASPTEHEAILEVIAPQLQVAIGGPRTRYLERQVTYDIQVANPGTSTAYDIQLVTFLPKGLKYVSADNKGAYNPQSHAVYWSLAELAAQDSGSVQLTALPVETGEQKLRVEGTANLNLNAKFEHTTNVQALTELAFSVQDIHDPIEVGSETTYEIRIVNNGNKLATNVQVAAALPPDLQPLSGTGPTKVEIQGQQVFMAPLERIGPREEALYRIVVRGLQAGDHVIAVQLASDEVPTPVTKQEGTKVYADQ